MKNVLLLNMSVMQGTKQHYYFSIDKKKIFCGISSLEPGTKQAIYNLLLNGQTLDKIIIMATKETMKAEKMLNQESVCDFYKRRILDFINFKDQFIFNFINNQYDMKEEELKKIDGMVLKYFGEKTDLYKEGRKLITNFQKTNSNDSNQKGALNEWLNIQCNKLLEEYLSNDNEKNKKQEFYSSFQSVMEEYKQILDQQFLQDVKTYKKAKFLDDKHFPFFPRKLTCIFKNYNELANQYNKILQNYIKEIRKNRKWKQKEKELYKKMRNIFEEEQERIKKEKDTAKSSNENKNENELVVDYIRFRVIISLFSSEEQSPLKEVIDKSKEIWEEQKSKAKQKNFFELISFYNDKIEKNRSSKEVVNEVFHVLDEINKIDNKEEINLYIDTQGGDRNTQQILNSAVEMLQLQNNIRVMQSVGTEFNRFDIVHQVKDVSEANRMFEMVSGMYEFINYGKAKTLSGYFVSEQKNKAVEHKMVEAMENFSRVLAVCNVNSFFPALKKLRNAINSCKKSSTDPLFSYFIQYIEKEYKELLQAVNERNENILIQKEIRWCVDKGMYMQAITLLEAKMPEYFIKNGIFFYARNKNEINKVKEELKKLKSNSSHSALYKFDDIFHYIIKYYIPEQLFKNGYYVSWNSDADRIINIEGQEKNENSDRKKHWYLISDFMKKNENVIKIYSNYNNKEKGIESGELVEETSNSKYGLLNIIYNEYIQLSNIRNELNHANNVNDPEWLIQCLKQFFEDIDQLLEYKKKDSDCCKPQYIEGSL